MLASGRKKHFRATGGHMIEQQKAFRWTEAYSVRIASLDKEHQGLFQTIGELNTALATGEGNEALVPILQKLSEYTVTHFTAEEILMEKHKFPGLATHRAQHKVFCDRIATSMEDFEAGKSGVPVTLAFFLLNWLKEHVQTADKQYSRYLNERGEH